MFPNQSVAAIVAGVLGVAISATAGAQTGGDAPVVAGAGRIRRKNFGGEPNIDARWKFYIQGQHADNSEAAILKPQRRTLEIRPAGENPFPKAVTHDHSLIALLCHLSGKQTPHQRRNAEHAKEIIRDRAGIGADWFAPTSDCGVNVAGIFGYGREAPAAITEIVEVRLGEGHSVALLVQLAQLDDSLLVRIGQRPQKNGVEHAEDGRRCTDAEGEREDRDGGEGGGFRESAESVFEISDHRFSSGFYS